jgi:hypothetical protein
MKIGKLKKEEEDIMKKLVKEKYSCEWWNNQR